jgi:hypothetical protein
MVSFCFAENTDFENAYVQGKILCGEELLTNVNITAFNKESGMAVAVNAVNGNYALGLWKGEWTITASKEGYYLPKTLQVKLNNKQTSDINIDLVKSNAWISGIVINENQKPVPNAFITSIPDMFASKEGPKSDDQSKMMPSVQFTNVFSKDNKTDENGKFKIDINPGSYLLSAHASGYEMSQKNPLPKIPGMEDIPEQFRGMMMSKLKGVGIPVEVKNGETRSGVVIILAPATVKPHKDNIITDENDEKIKTVKPQSNILIGESKLTPNNVLHWTRKENKDESAFYVIVRSTDESFKAPKAEIVTFTLPKYFYGYPADSFYSFTDNTAVPGQTYWYAVYEKIAGKTGPYSNIIKITTSK